MVTRYLAAVSLGQIVRAFHPSSRQEYWLFQSSIASPTSVWGNRILPPGGASASSLTDRIKTSQMNVNINSISVGGTQLCLVYNDMGVPFRLGNGDVEFPLSDTTGLIQLTADITITLLDNNGNTSTITVSSETGFVQ